jgi:hypothetical protein
MTLIDRDGYKAEVLQGNEHGPSLAAKARDHLRIDAFAFANLEMRTQEGEHGPHGIGESNESWHGGNGTPHELGATSHSLAIHRYNLLCSHQRGRLVLDSSPLGERGIGLRQEQSLLAAVSVTRVHHEDGVDHAGYPKAQGQQAVDQRLEGLAADQDGNRGKKDSEQNHGDLQIAHPTPKEVVATSHSSSPRAEHRRGGHHGAIRPAPDVQYTQALPGDSYLPRQDASLRRLGRKDAHNG